MRPSGELVVISCYLRRTRLLVTYLRIWERTWGVFEWAFWIDLVLPESMSFRSTTEVRDDTNQYESIQFDRYFRPLEQIYEFSSGFVSTSVVQMRFGRFPEGVWDHFELLWINLHPLILFQWPIPSELMSNVTDSKRVKVKLKHSCFSSEQKISTQIRLDPIPSEARHQLVQVGVTFATVAV